MNVKKYIADTMPEAMNIIRKELGPEAVILNSKEVNRGRFFGLFKKKSIEVIAAIDPQPVIRQEKKTQLDKMKTKPLSLPSKETNNNSEILDEIKHLKKIIEIQSQKSGADLLPDYQLALEYLLEQEVDSTIAEKIINQVVANFEKNDKKPNIKNIYAEMEAVIEDELNEFSYKGISGEKKIVQFVGPTGVGKTTTIAKVAAQLMLVEKKKVAFITTDTYRIAAIEQLKTYARILNVPLEVVYNVDDYKRAVEKLSAYDLILVDTAGRNFRDQKYIKELQEMMDDSADIATYLVLSLTAKPKDLIEIYNQFYQIPLTELIFTKVDETTQFGSMLNIVLTKRIGIAYITNGQDVPDNLLKLSPKEISRMIVGGSNE